MIEVKVPNKFYEERSYIIEVLLKEYLGLHFKLVNYDGLDYILSLPNNRKLIIRDYFFSKISTDNYLSETNIPKNVIKMVNPFIVETDIPAIYGNEEMIIETDKIVCGIDIFASSFFMLTRWEEYVNKTRDSHNRFPAVASVAYKNKFLDRPVVNEYVEMLWNMLKHIGIEQERKNREFQFINTHDVDRIRKWPSFTHVLKAAGGDVLKRRNIQLARKRLIEYKNIKLNKQTDPFDTFDWLMDLSEKVGIRSRFYFMSGGITDYDNRYNIEGKNALEIIRRVKERNHIIGFHPSYNSYSNPFQWKKEKSLLEKVTNQNLTEGRQHYLRFEIPYTWQIWQDNGMKKDSTLSYADKEGFRCGTCYEFPVYNFLTNKKLKLLESPLIAMEGSLITYQDISADKMLYKIKRLIDKTSKYNGQFVFLWHNSSFNNSDYDSVYKDVIEYASKKSL